MQKHASWIRRHLPWLTSAIGLTLFVILILQIDITEVSSALRQVNLLFILPSISCSLLDSAIRLWRWQLILRPLKEVSLNKLLDSLTIGFAANKFLPGRIGDVLRAYLAGQDVQLPMSLMLGSILLEKVLDALTLLSILIMGVLVTPELRAMRDMIRIATFVLIVGLVCLALVYLSFTRIVALSKSKWNLSRLFSIVETQMSQFFRGFKSITQITFLSKVIILGALAWLAEYGALYCLILGFHINLPPTGIAVLFAATILSLTVPIAPAGLGTFQLVVLYSLGLLNVSHNTAFAFAIVWNAVYVSTMTLPGIVLGWRRGLSISSIMDR